MKYYVKQQFFLLLFFLGILFLLLYKQQVQKKVFKTENLVEVIILEKNCNYKLGRKTSKNNMSYIKVKYSDSIQKISLEYNFCDSLKTSQKIKLFRDKENEKLYLKHNTNYNSLIYFLIVLIVLTLIPYKLFKK